MRTVRVGMDGFSACRGKGLRACVLRPGRGTPLCASALADSLPLLGRASCPLLKVYTSSQRLCLTRVNIDVYIYGVDNSHRGRRRRMSALSDSRPTVNSPVRRNLVGGHPSRVYASGGSYVNVSTEVEGFQPAPAVASESTPWERPGRGHSRKKMLNNTFEAGMCMKTKDRKTQCPNRNRLIVPRFRHLRRIYRYFAENCCF